MSCCPFPDCATRSSAESDSNEVPAELVADEVYLCRGCGRLAFRCITANCQALNRPFSHFCRRCGETQYPATGPTAMKRWEEVQRFDSDWTFKLPRDVGGRGGSPAHAEPIVLSQVQKLEEFKGFRARKILIEWAFIDGLLAIHQGGGFLALVNPFGDLKNDQDAAAAKQNSAIVWTRDEASLMQGHGSDLPNVVDGQADLLRPFPPMATVDRKYAVFSTPYAVISVELGKLPGWHYRTGKAAKVLWTADLTHKSRLAATPVLLTRQKASPRRHSPLQNPPTSNRIGLLFYNSNSSTYSWRVVRLDAESPETDVAEEVALDRAISETPLLIQGNPVQILSFFDHSLVIATPTGHWLWSCEAAGQGECSKILQLPAGEGAADEIALDEDVKARSVFSWRNQHLLIKHDGGQHLHCDESARQYFELWYARIRNNRFVAERRCIWPGDPDGTRRARPLPILSHNEAARPIGEWVSASDSLTKEMLFLVDGAGKVCRRPITGDGLLPLQSIQTGTLSEICGFRLQDPLLVIIREDVSVREDVSDGPRQKVELRSILHPDTRAVAAQLFLIANPLAWSNFLFTCEHTAQGFAIIRREYSVVRIGANNRNRPPIFTTNTTIDVSD